MKKQTNTSHPDDQMNIIWIIDRTGDNTSCS